MFVSGWIDTRKSDVADVRPHPEDLFGGRNLLGGQLAERTDIRSVDGIVCGCLAVAISHCHASAWRPGPGEVRVNNAGAHLNIQRSFGAGCDRYAVLSRTAVVEAAGIDKECARAGCGEGDNSVPAGQPVIIRCHHRGSVGSVNSHEWIDDVIHAGTSHRDGVGLPSD